MSSVPFVVEKRFGCALRGYRPGTFFRPWRDLSCFLSLAPRNRSLGYCLSPSGLTWPEKCQVMFAFYATYLPSEASIYRIAAAGGGCLALPGRPVRSCWPERSKARHENRAAKSAEGARNDKRPGPSLPVPFFALLRFFRLKSFSALGLRSACEWRPMMQNEPNVRQDKLGKEDVHG